MKIFRGAIALVASICVAAPALAGQGTGPQPNRGKVGINVFGGSPFSTQWTFSDLMKSAGDWTTPGSGRATYDKDGWPTMIPSDLTQVGSNIRLKTTTPGGVTRKPDYPGGDYTLTWEGNGAFRVGDSGFIDTRYRTQNSQTVHIPGDRSSVFLGISNTDPNDHLRNIELHEPGYGPGQADAGQTFNRKFTSRTQPFGTVRFLGWNHANSNETVEWKNRAHLEDRTYSKKGIPIERRVQLANELHSNPWFNMPVKANDDYVRHFAEYVKDNLDPDLKAYVEYGNEDWNPEFVGRQHLNQLASTEAKYDHNVDNWYKAWADEASDDFQVWEDVFSDNTDRVVRVAAGQTVNRFHSPRFYDRLADEGGFDAIAIASYFGPNGSDLDENTTADDIIEGFRQSIANASDQTKETVDPGFADLIGREQPKGDWAYHKALADYFAERFGRDVPLVAYEGGQGLAPHGGPNDVSWYDAYVEAERDPRLKAVYREFLDTWFDENGLDAELFNQFGSVSQIGQSGAWGALEFQDQALENAPKYAALLDYINAIPEPGSAALFAAPLLLVFRRRRSRA